MKPRWRGTDSRDRMQCYGYRRIHCRTHVRCGRVRVFECNSRFHIRTAAELDAPGRGLPMTCTVQRRVRDYLTRMADVEAPSVNVVVDEVGAPG